MNPLFDPAEFRLPPGVAHVCAGGETAALRSHDAALLRYVADKSRGPTGRTAQEAEVEAARTGLARLWGVSSADIGFVSNVAEGVSIVAESSGLARWRFDRDRRERISLRRRPYRFPAHPGDLFAPGKRH